MLRPSHLHHIDQGRLLLEITADGALFLASVSLSGSNGPSGSPQHRRHPLKRKPLGPSSSGGQVSSSAHLHHLDERTGRVVKLSAPSPELKQAALALVLKVCGLKTSAYYKDDKAETSLTLPCTVTMSLRLDRSTDLFSRTSTIEALGISDGEQGSVLPATLRLVERSSSGPIALTGDPDDFRFLSKHVSSPPTRAT